MNLFIGGRNSIQINSISTFYPVHRGSAGKQLLDARPLKEKGQSRGLLQRRLQKKKKNIIFEQIIFLKITYQRSVLGTI